MQMQTTTLIRGTTLACFIHVGLSHFIDSHRLICHEALDLETFCCFVDAFNVRVWQNTGLRAVLKLSSTGHGCIRASLQGRQMYTRSKKRFSTNISAYI